MSSLERFQNVVLGGGEAGKYIAWELARWGQPVAVVERGLIGGSCPNIACLPSKNVIHSAKVVGLVRRTSTFGLRLGPWSVDMAGVRRRKRELVNGLARVALLGPRRSKFGSRKVAADAQRLQTHDTVELTRAYQR
jgi:pyruvate/2-oxoglutarate dehydrogenase complex dihydrolipoamide dehydrogenase (E3) component